MRIEAENLQAAFEKAASELGCSVTQLDIKVLQNPSSGKRRHCGSAKARK